MRLPAQVASEPEHLSLEDVAAAEGWKNVETLLTCWQPTVAAGTRRHGDPTRKWRDRYRTLVLCRTRAP